MREGLKAARLDPTLGLLIDGGPRRQIVGDHPPWTPGSDHIAHGIEDHARRVIPLRRIFLHQRQVRSAKRPFFIANIAVVSALPAAFLVSHPKLDARLYLHS